MSEGASLEVVLAFGAGARRGGNLYIAPISMVHDGLKGFVARQEVASGVRAISYEGKDFRYQSLLYARVLQVKFSITKTRLAPSSGAYEPVVCRTWSNGAAQNY